MASEVISDYFSREVVVHLGKTSSKFPGTECCKSAYVSSAFGSLLYRLAEGGSDFVKPQVQSAVALSNFLKPAVISTVA